LKEKRPRKDLSPPVIEGSLEEFRLHTKGPKTNPAPDPVGEKEIRSTIVIEVDRSLLNTSSKQIITIALQKKTTDTPPINHPGKTGPKLIIFEKYELIKKKNQTLTNNTYAQFWKQTLNTQHRMLSKFDMEKGRMHMEFLQAQVPDPKVITDYKRATFEF
jgi:hypothetical protein